MIIGIIVFYLVSIFGAYKVAAQYVFSDYQRTMENVTDYVETNYVGSNLTKGHWLNDPLTIEAVAVEVSGNGNHDYPWKAVFLDSERQVAAKSGSWIYVRGRNGFPNGEMNLDDYLTEEQRKQLYEYWDSLDFMDLEESQETINRLTYDGEGSVVGISLDYAGSENQIRPIQLQIVELKNPENILTLKFSGEKAEYHLCCGMLDFRSNEYGTIINEFALADESIEHKDIGFIRLYVEEWESGGAYQDIYESLEARLNNDNISKVRNKLSGKYEIWEGKDYWYTNILQIDGEYYEIYLTGTYDETEEVIASEVFKNAVILQTIMFMIIGLLLIIAVNYLFLKREKLEEARNVFTSAVAHELKTPIAIIENQCECILEQVAPHKDKEYVRSIYNEASYMDKMVQSFLQYNRLSSLTHIEKKDCDLKELVQKEIEKYEDLFESAYQILDVELDEVSAVINEDLLALVIDNYLSNAYKYTSGNCRIDVRLKKEGKGWIFEVFNEGASIAEKDQESLWEIFTREDRARNREKKASGMGLPISRKILELHGFAYGCKTTEEGVRFYFKG